MKTIDQSHVLEALGNLLDLVPDFRVGQLIALCGDHSELRQAARLPDMNDSELLAVLNEKIGHYRGIDLKHVCRAPLTKSA